MLFQSILEAARRIEGHVLKTPVEYSPDLSEKIQGAVYVKLECQQYTRSFKLRGAMNRLHALTPEEKERGVVTASTGNHGMAVAFGLKQIGLTGTIYLPENASERKMALLRGVGATLAFYGTDSADTERYARQKAKESGQVFISPYNDPYVVAGQGTVGVELGQQLPALHAVFVPVGGGGLISGIAGYIKTASPETLVIGCLPENSPVMLESIQAGRIVPGTVRPTLSDGTAGGIEEDAITFALCRDLVDAWVTVSEKAIQQAMIFLFDTHGLVVEGAAGVAVASFLKYARTMNETAAYKPIKSAAIVLCGGNVDMQLFRRIVCQDAP